MVLGRYSSSLSQSRRVAVPKRFRAELGDRLIITKWYENCLVLLSVDSWQTLLERLTGKDRTITAPVRDTDRFVLGSAFEADTDPQGRVIIPKFLADYAKLEEKKEALFVGLGDRVEIWNPEEWAKREEYLTENASELLEKLAEKENA